MEINIRRPSTRIYKAQFTFNKYKLIYLSKTPRRFNITANINIIKIIIY